MTGGGQHRPRAGMPGKGPSAFGQTIDEVFGTPAEGIARVDPLDGFRDLLDPPTSPSQTTHLATEALSDTIADDIWAGSRPTDRATTPAAAARVVPDTNPTRARPQSGGTSRPWPLLITVAAAVGATVLLIVSH